MAFSASSPWYNTGIVANSYLDVLKIRPIPANDDDPLYEIEVDGPPWPLEQSFIESVGKTLNPTDMYVVQYEEEEHLRYRAVWQRS